MPGLDRGSCDWADIPGKQDAFVSLIQRWLRRMKEDGVNFNATVKITAAEEDRKDEEGLRTPFMHAMTWPATGDRIAKSAEIRVLAKAMLDGTYDVGREVVEPFILGAPGPASLATLMERVCLDDEVISWVSEAFLEKRMKPAESSAPKTRF